MQEIFDYLNRNSGALSAIFSCIVTIATVFTAYLTWMLVRESQKIRLAQISPQIVVTVLQREDDGVTVDMIVQNVGPGIAKDIRIRAIPDIELMDNYHISNIKMFSDGLRHLAPNEKKQFFYTMLVDNFDYKMKNPVNIYVYYSDIVDKKYFDQYTIDLKQFEGTLSDGISPIKSIEKSIEKIASAINNSSTGYRGLHVVTQSRKSLHKRRQETRDDWKLKSIFANLESLSEVPHTTTDQTDSSTS